MQKPEFICNGTTQICKSPRRNAIVPTRNTAYQRETALLKIGHCERGPNEAISYFLPYINAFGLSIMLKHMLQNKVSMEIIILTFFTSQSNYYFYQNLKSKQTV